MSSQNPRLYKANEHSHGVDVNMSADRYEQQDQANDEQDQADGCDDPADGDGDRCAGAAADSPDDEADDEKNDAVCDHGAEFTSSSPNSLWAVTIARTR